MSPTKYPPAESVEGIVARAADIMDSLKAENVLVLKMEGIADFTDFFVIGTAQSTTQARAIIRRIYETLKEEGNLPFSPPEDSSDRWSIIDYGSVVIHVFDAEARDHYRLEQVWGDAEELDWTTLIQSDASV